jgi:hypothetical protein
MINGSPAVSRAAEAALVGTDADVSAFVSSGMAAAQDADNRDEVEQIMAAGGPALQLAGPAFTALQRPRQRS